MGWIDELEAEPGNITPLLYFCNTEKARRESEE
jgi:hypothetical protein